jgi:Mitochondrial ribosomal death-associated protein 3
MIGANDARLIVLDGDSGIGKSTTMLNVALQYHQSESLVLYVPNLSSWTSGKYEFESTPNGYLQPTLCKHILSELVAWNESILKTLSSPVANQTLLQYCQSGISNLKSSSQVLSLVLDHILSNNCDKQVLIALDQVNALYCSTMYRDKESTPVTADKFILISKIHSILSSEQFGNSKVVRVVSQDMTKPLIRSRPLEKKIRQLDDISESPHIDVTRNRYQQLENVSEFGVLLPSKLESQQSFAEIKLGNAVKLHINCFDKAETEKVLDFYKSKNVVAGGNF